MALQKKSEEKRGGQVPDVVYAEASVCSIGGKSLFEAPPVTSHTVDQFYSESDLVASAVEKLKANGFNVLAINPITISIAAPPSVYERAFKTEIVAKEAGAVKEFGRVTTATFLDSPDTEMPQLIGTTEGPLSEVLEGVALNRRVYYMASASPPTKSYWHLDVPDGVSRALQADRAQQLGFTGKGIKVAMVDTGWYLHPFFKQHGYNMNPVVLAPAATNPDHDEVGHGTGESANIFAVAPDVEFTMVKQSDVNATASFKTAVDLHPHIISCSWGYDIPPPEPLDAATQALAAAVAHAVRSGIIVVFSAGNGHFSFPGCHPDVISAGGVYMRPDESCEATPYASAFKSHLYPGRNVPDVCGLVGLPPHASYIMLPMEPNDEIDKELAGGTWPDGDETAPDDGWAAISGTSAAAPQLAGICVLMKQAYPRLSLADARELLMKTARDVTAGTCSERTGGWPAGPGPDLATGSGLADAFRATSMARDLHS